MSVKRWTVGQDVVRARRGGYQSDVKVDFELMRITKIGTRYVYAAKHGHGAMRFEERFDAKSGKGVSYRHNEINEIWETREAFKTAQNDLETRQQFARAMNRWSMCSSEDVPLENIKQAAELLGLNLDEW